MLTGVLPSNGPPCYDMCSHACIRLSCIVREFFGRDVDLSLAFVTTTRDSCISHEESVVGLTGAPAVTGD